MQTSQNGWPVLAQDSSKLYTWIIPCRTGTIKIRMRNGSAGFLLAHYILWYGDSIEKLAGQTIDDWGYACRLIRGSATAVSNHSSATAADLNASEHPLGTRTLSAWKRAKIKARLMIYRGCLRSGAFYIHRKDEMHIEINKDLGSCEKLARRFATTDRGVRLLIANPSQKAVIFS